MITFGRLGHYGQMCNQMFQYALLLGVQDKLKCGISIPRNLHLPKKEGRFELDCFPYLSATTLTDKPRGMNRFKETRCGFDEAALRQPDNTDFHGYFQSWRYFEHCDEIVRDEFRFASSLVQTARLYMKNTQNRFGPTISVNVRRGDYLNHRDVFHVCAADYYRNAMAELAAAYPECQFWVISDDIPWCQQHLSRPDTVFVADQHYQLTLCLMSLCEHHIGSASTFSWWGAWLNWEPGRRAIFPDRWYGPKGPEYILYDLLWPGCETRPSKPSAD